MEKFGKVEKIENGIATIKILRDSACGDNCAACGLCPNREMTITLPTVSGLCTGDEVKLISSDISFVKGSAFGYLSLTVLLLLGGVCGSLLGGEWLAFLFALAFVGIGVLVIQKFHSKNIQIHIEKRGN